jgi:hypothetical protein
VHIPAQRISIMDQTVIDRMKQQIEQKMQLRFDSEFVSVALPPHCFAAPLRDVLAP